jgi:hypothetical protein
MCSILYFIHFISRLISSLMKQTFFKVGNKMHFDFYSSTSSIATSTLKMETVCFSEMLAFTNESTRRQNPEKHHHPHCRENLKPHKIYFINLFLYSSEIKLYVHWGSWVKPVGAVTCLPDRSFSGMYFFL